MDGQYISPLNSDCQGKPICIIRDGVYLILANLSSEKEAYPRFVVQFHNDNFILDERIKQPTEVKIFAYQIFIFKTPVQDEVGSLKVLN